MPRTLQFILVPLQMKAVNKLNRVLYASSALLDASQPWKRGFSSEAQFATAAKRLNIATSADVGFDSAFKAPFQRDSAQGSEYMPMPMVTVGPLLVNGKTYRVPLVNVDPKIVANTNIGCHAIEAAGGSFSKISSNSITVSPLVALKSEADALAFSQLLEDPSKLPELQSWFSEVTQFSELSGVTCNVIGKRVFVRFTATSGDSTSSEVLSRGVTRIMQHLQAEWTGQPFEVVPDLFEATDVSGRTIEAQVTLPIDVVGSILGTEVEDISATLALRQTLKAKIVQSAASRKLVLSLLLATGQDVAQLGLVGNAIETSHQLIRSSIDDRIINSVRISCVVPSIDISTSGNRNISDAQQVNLNSLGVAGTDLSSNGGNSQHLAKVICATVLANEIGALAKRAQPAVAAKQVATTVTARPATRTTNQRRKVLNFQEFPVLESARGLSTIKKPSAVDHANVTGKSKEAGNSAYLELVSEKCAAEFGWADPRLTVP